MDASMFNGVGEAIITALIVCGIIGMLLGAGFVGLLWWVL